MTMTELAVALAKQRTIVDVRTAANGHAIVDDHQLRVNVDDLRDQVAHQNVVIPHSVETQIFVAVDSCAIQPFEERMFVFADRFHDEVENRLHGVDIVETRQKWKNDVDAELLPRTESKFDKGEIVFERISHEWARSIRRNSASPS